MIRYFEGTVFNVNTKAKINTVNCMGVMGKGIALEFMLRYPKMYIDYKKKCENKAIKIGNLDYFENPDNSIIINFPTKGHFKYPSKLPWIEAGLKDFVDTYKEKGISSVAFPKLGTNNGGLNWDDVKILMEKHLSNIDIDVYICLDNKKEAEGIEKEMLEKFNEFSMEQLSNIVKLNIKQKNAIAKHIPYNRFWEIANTETIGIKTYSSMFEYFYKSVVEKKEEVVQISFFD